jgi:hypothetical protein
MPGAHPSIILCEPLDGKILVLNVSDATKHESTCYLDAGDHPAITKKSAVLYWRSRVVNAIAIEELKAQRETVFAEVLKEELLQRIFEGARNADDFAPKYLKYLR